MKDEVKRKISLGHWLFGFIFGIATGIGIKTTLSIGAVLLIGIIASYPLFIATRKIFKFSTKEYTFKDWFTSGFIYFLISWVLVWTVVHNIFGV